MAAEVTTASLNRKTGNTIFRNFLALIEPNVHLLITFELF